MTIRWHCDLGPANTLHNFHMLEFLVQSTSRWFRSRILCMDFYCCLTIVDSFIKQWQTTKCINHQENYKRPIKAAVGCNVDFKDVQQATIGYTNFDKTFAKKSNCHWHIICNVNILGIYKYTFLFIGCSICKASCLSCLATNQTIEIGSSFVLASCLHSVALGTLLHKNLLSLFYITHL